MFSRPSARRASISASGMSRPCGTRWWTGATRATIRDRTRPSIRYQRNRDLDVRLRTAAVDGLNRTLLTGMLPTDFLRGAGLLALSNIGPLRRIVMREGVLPRFSVPRLMRGAVPH